MEKQTEKMNMVQFRTYCRENESKNTVYTYSTENIIRPEELRDVLSRYTGCRIMERATYDKVTIYFAPNDVICFKNSNSGALIAFRSVEKITVTHYGFYDVIEILTRGDATRFRIVVDFQKDSQQA